MRRSNILTFLFLGSGVVLLGLMVRWVGLNGLLESFRVMGIWVVPYMLLRIIPAVFNIYGFAACFPGRRFPLPIWQLFLVDRAGGAINYVTPTATIGGDVVRVLLLAPVMPREQAMAMVVIAKASATLAKMLYLALGMLYLTQYLPLPAELQLSLGITIGLISLGLIGFVAFQRYGMLSKLVAYLGRLRMGQKWFQRLHRHLVPLDEQLITYYKRHGWRFVRSVLLHALAHVSQMIRTYLLLSLLLGESAPGLAAACMVAVAVAALDEMFFFVPGRLGTLEGARFVVLSALGAAQVYGLAFGLIARAEQLIWNGMGFVAYAIYTRLHSHTISREVTPVAPSS